jgi:hypothetical protein
MPLPNKVRDRLISGLKRLSPIIAQQKARDVSEADTVTLVKDLLSEVFGYNKYSELTGEYAIRGTYCDLAIKIEEKVTQIVEVKAIGTNLDDRHVKQAVDYASNQGIEWVILTNAIAWRLYHVIFSKPIDKRLLIEISIPTIDCRSEEQLETLYLFTKEGFRKGVHIALRNRQDATNRYMLAALIVNNDSVLGTIRRELRRVVDVLVTEEEIAAVLRGEVIKRDVLEGPTADLAAKRVSRTEDRRLRAAASEEAEAEPPSSIADPEVVQSGINSKSEKPLK